MRESYSKKTGSPVKSASTTAKQTASLPLLKNGSTSVSRIENGFLVHHSGEHKGKYVTKTIFSPSNPIQIKGTKIK